MQQPVMRIIPTSMASILWGIILLFFISPLIGVAQEEPVSHQLEGIQINIEQVDKDIESAQKQLANDPSLLQSRQAFQNAKAAADAFYQSSNNKYQTGTPELAQAKAQQQNLDAAANSALQALKAARAALVAKDPHIANLENNKRDLLDKKNLLLSKAKIKALLLNLSCAASLNANTAFSEAKACLDKIYDGANQPALKPEGQIPGSTPFFSTIHTSSGNATVLTGLPVMDPARASAKAAFWKKYLSEHKDLSNVYKDEEAWENEWNRTHNGSSANPALPSALAQPAQHLFLNSPATGKSNFIDVPSPALPAKPASTMDMFNNKVREILQQLKQMNEPIRQSVVASVAAVRG